MTRAARIATVIGVLAVAALGATWGLHEGEMRDTRALAESSAPACPQGSTLRVARAGETGWLADCRKGEVSHGPFVYWKRREPRWVGHNAEGVERIRAQWSRCESQQPGEALPRLERVEWSAGRLVVEVKDYTYCAGTRIASPEGEVAGDTLRLRWGWKAYEDVPRCECRFTARFELSGLERRDYAVSLVRDTN